METIKSTIIDIGLVQQFYVLNILGTIFLSYFAFVFTRTHIKNKFRLLLSGTFLVASSIFYAWAGDAYNGGIEIIFNGFKVTLSVLLAILCFFLMVHISRLNETERAVYRKGHNNN